MKKHLVRSVLVATVAATALTAAASGSQAATKPIVVGHQKISVLPCPHRQPVGYPACSTVKHRGTGPSFPGLPRG